MKFKYRWFVIRSVALIMVIYISLVALSMPICAVVDTSRGEGDDFNITAASTFPMTVGFAFRSGSNSDYNYITATDVGGYGQEYNRTLTGTDEFTYTFDELNENATTTRYLHYTFNNIYWSSQSLFGYRYGFQPLILSCDSLGSNEACETIVLRASDVVFNTYVFDHYRGSGYTLADLAYLGIPVISAPQVVGPSEEKYVGTCSIMYSVTDQHGNTKDFNYSISYSSENNDYIPLLNVDDLYTYYNAIDPASDSPKILISDWYVFWDVDYYEYVDNTQPSYIDVKVYGANDNLVHSDGISITDDIGLTFSQWASHFSESGYSVEVTDSYVRLTYTSGFDTYSGNIYDGINPVTGSTVITQGTTYDATLNYDVPDSSTLPGTWFFNETLSSFFGDTSDSFYERVYINYDLAHSSDTFDEIYFWKNQTFQYEMRYESATSVGYTLGYNFKTNTWGSYDEYGDEVRYIFINSIPDRENPYLEKFTTWLISNARKVSNSTNTWSLNQNSAVSLVNDVTAAAASGEWVKVDSDKRNIVQIGYPLYDTSAGDPEYASLLSYPDFNNFLQGSTIDIPTVPGYPGEPDEEVSSLTRWLGAAISGFTDVELWEGFSIGGLLAIIVSFSVVMMFLKVFAGG